MFLMRKEKSEDLKQGRTIVYLANKLGITRPYLSSIFNGRMTIKKEFAIKILDVCFADGSKPKIAEYFIEI